MTILSQQTGQFSGYDLDHLRALVLKGLRVVDTTRYSLGGDTADYEWIDDALNRGIREFVRDTRFLRTFAVVELKSGYKTYRLPHNFIDFMSATYFDSSITEGYLDLEITTLETLNHNVAGWRTATGTPEKVYVDRQYGSSWMFGVYPTPNIDSDTVTFDTEYGEVVEWVCPLFTFNQEYGVIVRMSGVDQYYLNTDAGVVGRITDMNKSLYLEYYRLAEPLVGLETSLGTQGVQYSEIPEEYHVAPIFYAISDLLADNPEDSVEMKRALVFMKRFQEEVRKCKEKRKAPLQGEDKRGRPVVWNYMSHMDFYKGLP